MAASSDLITQEEPANTKLHPYLVALVRWCVSCLWSTANILIHRLLTAPLPPIAGGRSRCPRAASSAHLHPEPRVECVELHRPRHHTIDVIFVHGLYGSLENTWRQGDWRPKYKIEPNKIPLIDPSNSCECHKQTEFNKSNHYESNIRDESLDIYKNMIIPDDDFMTEKFYNNTLLDQVEIVDNYELQANFVRDLFKNECELEDKAKSKVDISDNDCECRTKDGRRCEAGCGCICDECYSSCWPRDWIKVDYPEARVISVNYTSDPYLWRPLWVKGHKRLRLHERAEQMTRQLLALGVGRRPIIWVGHSKGGLFVKQIYCEAYEAYLRMQNEAKAENLPVNNPNPKTEQNIDNEEVDNNYNKNREQKIKDGDETSSDNNSRGNDAIAASSDIINSNGVGSKDENNENSEEMSSNSEEDIPVASRASLWQHSAGFMFYSVPHRGSPLADIKTPLTARSIELLEISKDCALVLSLQQRWLRAQSRRRAAVRSLVETARTLMAVLWLRIVSVNSADAGIGALHGVSVDHREICKPSSRACPLYTELLSLMRTALYKCRCQ